MIHEEIDPMAEDATGLGRTGSATVSALGLRWAALRGMLGSPLIDMEEQQPLRSELVSELFTLERSFAELSARTPAEIAAKLDVLKVAMRDAGLSEQRWIDELLGIVTRDLRALPEPGRALRPERSNAHLVRGAGPAPARDGVAAPPVGAPLVAEPAG
jgi:hypothetical protein